MTYEAVTEENYNLKGLYEDLKDDLEVLNVENIHLNVFNVALKEDLCLSKRETICQCWNLKHVKQMSNKCLEKFRHSNVVKNTLQDELSHILSAKKAQDQVFERYCSMMESDQKELCKEWDGRGGGK